MNQSQLTQLRVLKGTPVTVLLFLQILGAACTLRHIADSLGYTENTVRSALRYLAQAGYVSQPSPQTWQLASLQPLLPAFDHTPVDNPAPPVHNRAYSQPLEPQNTQNLSVSPTTTTTTTTDIHQQNVVVVVERPNAQKLSDPGNPEPQLSLLQALRSAGIGANMWPAITALPHVTPDYIAAMHRYVSRHPDRRKRTTAFLIHCIKSGDPVPTPPRPRYLDYKED